MKGLNKIALVAAIAAASTAQAELVAMDEAAMAATTGQAGLTIDINTATIEIGEIAYEDQGFIAINDFTLQGAHGTALDDIRIFVDVTDGSNFGGAKALGADYLGAAGITPAGYEDGQIDPIAVNDGDLIIAIRGQDGFVDFGMNIGSVSLVASAQKDQLGSFRDITGNTVLVSEMQLSGNLGPIDMVIHNQAEKADVMEISAFFNITDVSAGLDGAVVDENSNRLSLPFMNTTLGLAIHNNRGVQTITGGTEATSLAHVQLAIGATEESDPIQGLRVNLKDFSGDIDLKDITMGGDGAASIGSLYMTDMVVKADMVIYGHED